MDHIITASDGMQQEFMVSEAVIGGSAADIAAVVGEAAPGTIIYTAGYESIKQKDFDGSWVEVG